MLPTPPTGLLCKSKRLWWTGTNIVCLPTLTPVHLPSLSIPIGSGNTVWKSRYPTSFLVPGEWHKEPTANHKLASYPYSTNQMVGISSEGASRQIQCFYAAMGPFQVSLDPLTHNCHPYLSIPIDKEKTPSTHRQATSSPTAATNCSTEIWAI